MKTRRKNAPMLLRDYPFALALLASIIVIGCITLVVSRVHNWVPIAIIVGVAAGLFTLIAYKLRKGRGNDV